MNAKVAAICGKGGVGKTTVSAMTARILARSKGTRALLVDADPAGGLSMALSLPAERTVNDVRIDTIEQIKRRRADNRDLAVSVDYMLMEAVAERGRIAFLSIGRPQEHGCYCAVNSLLREAIELLAGKFDLVLIDAEAGIEQMNRNVMSAVDTLILVSDTSAKGLRVARDVRDVAEDAMREHRAFLLLNRIRSEQEAQAVSSSTDLRVAGWLPEDDTVRRFDADERSFFDLPSCPALEALERVFGKEGILAG